MAERLGQHAALAELWELEEHHAVVLLGVATYDIGRPVRATVERHEEPGRGDTRRAVGAQGAVDALLLVESRQHEIGDVVVTRCGASRRDTFIIRTGEKGLGGDPAPGAQHERPVGTGCLHAVKYR